MTRTGPRPVRAQLFVTCLVDAFFPDVGRAVVDVLLRQGIEPTVPLAQTCCGQPAFNAGAWDDARAMARHTIDLLSEDEAPVVVPSGSCADMIVHQYAVLLGDDAYSKKAAAVAARTFEFSQFLVDVLGAEDVGGECRGCVAYHACCHGLRGLGIDAQPRSLLAHVNGIARQPLTDAEACCGFGGLFAIKMSDISGAILERKLDDIEASGADMVVATDVSCLMHMAGGLRRRGDRVRFMHLAEMLAPPSSGRTGAPGSATRDRAAT